MTSPNGAGYSEGFPVPGRKLKDDWLPNVFLPSLDPANKIDPSTAAATLTSVYGCKPLLLCATLATEATEGTSVLFTAPTGTSWQVMDLMWVATTNSTAASTNSTIQFACNSLVLGAAVAVPGTGAIRRAAAVQTITAANAVVGAGETFTAITATGDTQTQRGMFVVATLQRLT